MAVQLYQVHVPDSVLEDLKARLARTRWPDEIPGSGWDYGLEPGLHQGTGRILAHRIRLAEAGRGHQPMVPLHHRR